MNQFEQPSINKMENEEKELKEQVIEKAKSKFEAFKRDKSEIVKALERDHNLSADVSEEEMLKSSADITSFEGWDAEEKMLQLLKEGVTPEGLGTSREELIKTFSDQGEIGIEEGEFAKDLGEILETQKKDNSRSI